MAKRATAKDAQPSDGTRVTVRHYCQGIGDSHLLRFPKDDGTAFWMLIDCGVHSSVSGGSDTMDRVVANIASVTGRRLDVIVVTHEHTDHVSAFLTAAENFTGFAVGEVWMAWTENPADAQARALDKYKQQALSALQMASARLDRSAALSPHLSEVRSRLSAVLGFNFGAKGDKVRAQRDAASALAQGRVRYIEPTDPPLVLPGVSGLRIFPLGPPRGPVLLGLTDRASEMYGNAFSGGGPMARALSGACAAGARFEYDDEAPFDMNVGSPFSQIAASGAVAAPGDVDPEVVTFARKYYFGPSEQPGRVIRSSRRTTVDSVELDQSWRRIDNDWLGLSADLAMQLDNRTNNTSLVLAFEFTDSGRVLLFAADAQVGNWLSWQDRSWTFGSDKVTGPELVSRAIYYKVGHHGSHNATPKTKGLDMMKSPDLAAFVPTNKVDAKKVGWGQMPFASILEALQQKCSGRVIRADDPWIVGTGGPGFPLPSGSVRAVRHEAALWVEVDIA